MRIEPSMEGPGTMAPPDLSLALMAEPRATADSQAAACVRRGKLALLAGAFAATFGLGWSGAILFHGAAPPQRSVVAARVAPEPAPKPVAVQRAPDRPVRPEPAPPKEAAAKPATPAPLPVPRPVLPARIEQVKVDADSQTLPQPADLRMQPLTPVPETKPVSIPGWSVISASGSHAVLSGPAGPINVSVGDDVASLGQITSIVRWGSYWVVATSRGVVAN